jgi:hypothetical protein
VEAIREVSGSKKAMEKGEGWLFLAHENAEHKLFMLEQAILPRI